MLPKFIRENPSLQNLIFTKAGKLIDIAFLVANAVYSIDCMLMILLRKRSQHVYNQRSCRKNGSI